MIPIFLDRRELDSEIEIQTKGYSNELMYQKCYDKLISQTTDIQFIFGSDDDVVKVPAHKSVLSASSPVFDAMFNGELKEGNDVEIVDASPDAFKEFLQLFYGHRVKLTMDHIAEVLKLIDKYDVVDCYPICIDFLTHNLTVDNVLWALYLAIKYRITALKEFCQRMIRDNYSIIFKSFKFDEQEKLCVTPNNLLSDDELKLILPYVVTAPTVF